MGQTRPVQADDQDRPLDEPCPNCGATLKGPYCSTCGQKRPQRISFLRVLTDALDTLVSLDSKVVRTFTGLTRNPGRVAREYVEGRRSTYVNPIKYAFFTTTLFLLVVHLFDIPVWKLGRTTRENFMPIFSLISYMVFVNVFGPVTVQRLAFWKQPRNLAECYVFAVFSYGHLAFLYMIASFFGAYDNYRNYLLILTGAFLYLTWGLVGFYRAALWRAALTAVPMVLSYYVVGALVGFGFRRLM